MIFKFLKKQQDTIPKNWVDEANADMNKLKEEFAPKLAELSQKYFKSDIGFNLISSRVGEKLSFTTEWEGLGTIPDYFFQAIVRDVKGFLQNKTAAEAENFCTSLKKALLDDCIIK
jgi:hypothetical protein